MPLDALHKQIMANAQRPVSRHDLLAFDLPWIGQLAEEGIIEPLDETVAAARYSTADFHNAALRGSCRGCSAWRAAWDGPRTSAGRSPTRTAATRAGS